MRMLVNVTGKSIIFGIALLVLISPAAAQSPTQTNKPTIAAKIKGTRGVITGGKIESIKGTILMVGKDNVTYTVNTDSRTVIRRKFFGATKLTEMQAGDNVNIHGKWADETQKTILATLVRDLSIQKRNGVFFGQVNDFSETVISITSPKIGRQMVTISNNTRLVNRKMQRITLADITPGHKIRVKGLWDSASNTITEVVQAKNFSLPVIVTPTGKK